MLITRLGYTRLAVVYTRLYVRNFGLNKPLKRLAKLLILGYQKLNTKKQNVKIEKNEQKLLTNKCNTYIITV